ncbi:MAG: glycoside hydrolase family 127 protein [Erysipelotrichaceae bacterium]
MKNVNFNKVIVLDETFKNRIETVNGTTIRHAIKKLYDTPRIENFINANKAINGEPHGEFIGITFDDTDLYKIIEGAGYILSEIDDPELEEMIDKLIVYISNAQEDDGYITTRHTIDPSLKWICQDAHELYNFGHLIEGAIAHFHGTSKKSFLNIAIKAANYLCNHFTNENVWVPGHQEIELALIKLYELTEEEKYLYLAEQFLANRGKGLGVPNSKYSIFTENPIWLDYWDGPYHQDTMPLEYIYKVEGHAVRAMYMYSAMAMLSKYRNPEYLESLNRVWDNLLNKNAYITGGIGSSVHNEGFTTDYDLPNLTAYCETCASVGMVYWNSEMFLHSGETKYLDVIDREIRNGIICGLSEDGTKFNYDNPLESDGSFERKEWFDCSCCPTQTIRFTPSIAKYIYSQDNGKFYINLLISSEYNEQSRSLKLVKETNKMSITHNLNDDIYIRVPSYAVLQECSVPYELESGFVKISGQYKEVEILIGTGIRFIHSNANIVENANKVAVQYDGYIYCIEEVDNENFDKLSLNSELSYIIKSQLIGNTKCEAIEARNASGELVATLVPYYLWNNRGKGKMKVWIPNSIGGLYNL